MRERARAVLCSRYSAGTFNPFADALPYSRACELPAWALVLKVRLLHRVSSRATNNRRLAGAVARLRGGAQRGFYARGPRRACAGMAIAQANAARFFT